MSILDYDIIDLLFAHWLSRKRDYLARHEQVPKWIDERLDALRPHRNPNCSVFILDP